MTHEENKKVQVARLDANGIYQGIDEIDADDLTETHVHLPNGCDLPPGTYRWDNDRKTFIALQRDDEAAAPDPHALRSIAVGLMALQQHGLTLPAETLNWLDFYCTSIDFMGNLNDETAALVELFLKRKG